MAKYKVILTVKEKKPIAWEYEVYRDALDKYTSQCEEVGSFMSLIGGTCKVQLWDGDVKKDRKRVTFKSFNP